ncbi:hypothetical protein DUNSADRAFT_16862 [Dunaliella salina]|uniref:AP2/ERF domain-containing protein n=1 Tax=Dunaliella salina TaxID=3046 RepID=A0ABQ7G2P2_DUNSA|nr:hypothetical protein DUNSADRAFT_16862 [Dunaliella salina]|eukprot:KAF5828876.1 hypothetical protein DUNSADRAFT_16862 [Dunaliella salina]
MQFSSTKSDEASTSDLQQVSSQQPLPNSSNPQTANPGGARRRFVSDGKKPRARAPGPQSIKSSPYIGVSLVKNTPSRQRKPGGPTKWEAHIWCRDENEGRGRQLHLGAYGNEEQAARYANN